MDLASGSLVIMKGEMQKYWHHRIHPTKQSKGARINLTFRNVIS
jgi:alkylated DNA repair dioxygenase AlkB